MRPGRGEGGQAAVELALVLPLLAVLALALLQVGIVVRDQVLVSHTAREAAREAAVTADGAAVRRAALAGARLDGDRLTVEVGHRGPPGARVVVTVRYDSPTTVPVVGALVGDVTLSAKAAMRIER